MRHILFAIAMKLLPLLTVEHLRQVAKLIETLLVGCPQAAAGVAVAEKIVEDVAPDIVAGRAFVPTQK